MIWTVQLILRPISVQVLPLHKKREAHREPPNPPSRIRASDQAKMPTRDYLRLKIM